MFAWRSTTLSAALEMLYLGVAPGFFGGHLRGHICVHWQLDSWLPRDAQHTLTFGSSSALHERKAMVVLNADGICARIYVS